MATTTYTLTPSPLTSTPAIRRRLEFKLASFNARAARMADNKPVAAALLAQCGALTSLLAEMAITEAARDMREAEAASYYQRAARAIRESDPELPLGARELVMSVSN